MKCQTCAKNNLKIIEMPTEVCFIYTLAEVKFAKYFQSMENTNACGKVPEKNAQKLEAKITCI